MSRTEDAPNSRRQRDMNDEMIGALNGNGRTPATCRAEAEGRAATRPCVACRKPMIGGRCKAHGAPAEDRGAWLYLPRAAS